MPSNVDLSEYLKPSEKVMDAVSKLEIFYQISHQKEMKDFAKKGGSKHFSGTIGEYIRVKEIKELLSLEGKPWSYLTKAIFLLNNYTPEVDVSIFHKLSEKDANELVTILKDGVESKKIVEKWIIPLSKEKNAIDAIYDAIKVNIDHQFQILKLAKMKNYRKKKKIHLYGDILDIENPDSLIYYLQNIREETSDCLIVAIQRNKKYDFKGVFLLFLIFNGYLYSIDNSSRRLNLDNTCGMRNPSKYLEREYSNIWLPIDLLFEKQKKVPILRGQRVFKIYTWDKIRKKNIGIIYWMNMFLYRIIEYISSTNIDNGLIPKQTVPLLKSANKKVDFTYETKEQHGRNEYLLNKYKNKVQTKALVLAEDKLPAIIGTKKYIQEVIAYKKREKIADEIEKALFEDFDKNKNKVKKWIQGFLDKQDAEKIVIRALEDKEYAYMHYPQFTEKRVIELKKKKILSIGEYSWYYPEYYNWFRFGKLLYDDIWKHYYEQICYFCGAKQKKIMELTFIDYRQFLEFFELEEKDVPRQIIDHLHQKRQMYLGNSILDDLDPVDGINDPWFRGGDSAKEKYRFAHISPPKIYIEISVCLRCLNKYQRRADKNK